DDEESFLRLLRIKTQHQPAVPSAEIDSIVRPFDQRPRARTLGRVELPRLAGIGIHLDQKQQPADLVEIEIKRLATLAVGSDDASHQSSFTHRNADRFELPATSLRGGETGHKAKKDERVKLNGSHGLEHPAQQSKSGQA